MEVLVEGLKSKPFDICCTDVWAVEILNFYKLSGYSMYYNKSKLNRADGVVIYIRENISEESEIIKIYNLSLINTVIKLYSC